MWSIRECDWTNKEKSIKLMNKLFIEVKKRLTERSNVLSSRFLL